MPLGPWTGNNIPRIENSPDLWFKEQFSSEYRLKQFRKNVQEAEDAMRACLTILEELCGQTKHQGVDAVDKKESTGSPAGTVDKGIWAKENPYDGECPLNFGRHSWVFTWKRYLCLCCGQEQPVGGVGTGT